MNRCLTAGVMIQSRGLEPYKLRALSVLERTSCFHIISQGMLRCTIMQSLALPSDLELHIPPRTPRV
jgi:hypothetical protein